MAQRLCADHPGGGPPEGHWTGGPLLTALCDVLYHVAQQTVRSDRRDLLPHVEQAYWLLRHGCAEGDAPPDPRRGSQPTDDPERYLS